MFQFDDPIPILNSGATVVIGPWDVHNPDFTASRAAKGFSTWHLLISPDHEISSTAEPIPNQLMIWTHFRVVPPCSSPKKTPIFLGVPSSPSRPRQPRPLEKRQRQAPSRRPWRIAFHWAKIHHLWIHWILNQLDHL